MKEDSIRKNYAGNRAYAVLILCNFYTPLEIAYFGGILSVVKKNNYYVDLCKYNNKTVDP